MDANLFTANEKCSSAGRFARPSICTSVNRHVLLVAQRTPYLLYGRRNKVAEIARP